MPVPMYGLLVLASALAFSVGGYATKLSEGLTRAGPTFWMFALFLLGAALQGYAMRGTALSVTYVVVLGLEAVTATALGLLLGEGLSLLKCVAASLVLAGVVLLRQA
jgi:quaternary ammonium compound-resistance protein SugE